MVASSSMEVDSLSEGLASLRTSPLSTVDALFSEDATVATLRDRFEASMASAGVEASKLPLLSRGSYASGALAPQSLVRYVGMVQDMANPEYYLPSMPTAASGRACTMFRDRAPAGATQDAEPKFAERRPLFVVPVPGLQPWAAEACGGVPAVTEAVSRASTKRPLCEEEDDDDEGEEGGASSTSKGLKTRPGAAAVVAGAAVSAETGVPCVVRVYGPCVPKLNDVVEFVGVLGGSAIAAPESAGLDPAPEGLDDYEAERLEDEGAWDPPTSRVARLHCVSYRVLPEWHPRAAPDGFDASEASEARRDVLEVLTGACAGDAVAGEFALLALLAKTEKRHTTRVVGAASLGLRCRAMRREVCDALHAALCALAPQVKRVATGSATAPLRAPGGEKLAPSDLQLQRGAVLLAEVDGAPPDTPMAHAAIRALAGALGGEKTVPYNFGFHEVNFDADLAAFLVSGVETGGLDVDCDVPLVPAAPAPVEVLLDDARLARARAYVAHARGLVVAIDDRAASDLEDQYLAARATGKINKINAEDRLNAWVSASKLYAKSLATTQLAPAHFNYCFDLEDRRFARLGALRRELRPKA